MEEAERERASERSCCLGCNAGMIYTRARICEQQVRVRERAYARVINNTLVTAHKK